MQAIILNNEQKSTNNVVSDLQIKPTPLAWA